MNKHLIFVLIVITYTVAFIATFDTHYNTLPIFSVALVSLAGWLYGIRIGLASVIFFILLNTAILCHVSGDLYDILMTYDPLGIIVGMGGTMITGALKESGDQLKRLRNTLSMRVEEETEELRERVQQLIAKDENDRIRIGQELHDGIGQLLTGMLLHSEALASQLKELNRPEAKMAEQIREHCQSDLLLVRKLARSFLPNHLNHSGFESAVREMVDYFEQSSVIRFKLRIERNDAVLPRTTSLQLYRILQEALCYILEYTQPKRIEIVLSASEPQYVLSVHAQESIQTVSPETHYISKLMQYRADSIRGTLATQKTGDSSIRLTCSWPKGEEHA